MRKSPVLFCVVFFLNRSSPLSFLISLDQTSQNFSLQILHVSEQSVPLMQVDNSVPTGRGGGGGGVKKTMYFCISMSKVMCVLVRGSFPREHRQTGGKLQDSWGGSQDVE